MKRKLFYLLALVSLLCVQAGCGAMPGSAQAVALSPATTFTLSSPDVGEGGRLPVEYTCDGSASTLALSWNGAPKGTAGYAVIMHHVASPSDIHWYWTLYDIPASVTSLPKNTTGIGKLGNNFNTGKAGYAPPCSQGPGDKTYTITVYALSGQPQISLPADKITRDVLLAAIKDLTLASAQLNVVYARTGAAAATPQPAQKQPNPNAQPQNAPPAEAITACAGKAEQNTCEFTWSKGTETGVCEMVQSQLACSPKQNGQGGKGGQNNGAPAGGPAYNIEQATSDKAQGMTISYDALAFLTGDLGADSFFPPGKVADFWGFQFLRDNDPSEMGHAGDFLTSAAMNTLNNLSAAQRAQLVALAKTQVADINAYGYKRFVLMDAFRRMTDGKLPAGKTELSKDAVKTYSAELYQLDGQISFARAQLMGQIINTLSAQQRGYFDAMVGKGMKEWNTAQEPADVRGLDRDTKVAVMTYAADLFSWYAGSVEADVYFCPERHGTYFGSFYLKDIKAMSDPTYAIPTNLTGDLGEMMLGKLAPEQAQSITSLVDIQKPALQGIVSVREQVSNELRKFKDGKTASRDTVMTLMAQYGAYDGEIIYNMAAHFAAVKKSLSAAQQTQLTALRTELLGNVSHPSGAYLYSQPIAMPAIPSSDFLFK